MDNHHQDQNRSLIANYWREQEPVKGISIKAKTEWRQAGGLSNNSRPILSLIQTQTIPLMLPSSQQNKQHEMIVKSLARNKCYNHSNNHCQTTSATDYCSSSTSLNDDDFSDTRRRERLFIKIGERRPSSLSLALKSRLISRNFKFECYSSNFNSIRALKVSLLGLVLLLSCSSSYQSLVLVQHSAASFDNDTNGSEKIGELLATSDGKTDNYGSLESSVSSSLRDLRDVRSDDKLQSNVSQIFDTLLKRRPYSKYWTVEQKWDDLFRRVLSIQGTVKNIMLKNMLRDVEFKADLSLSKACQDDLKFIQNYARRSKNLRWMVHMLDSTGKNEPGMLTGNLANLGHVIQCIKVRAPSRPTNESFDERYFEQQTEQLGEQFRGKYCLASIRPISPPKPHLVSRFSRIFNESILSNISYMGESDKILRQRTRQMLVPSNEYASIDKKHLRLDQVPFESELYAFMIAQRNFVYTLPIYTGVCYPSSCSRDDIRMVLQKTMDDQHQVVDIEFECEQEDVSLWGTLITPRLVSFVILITIVCIVTIASLARYILVSKLAIVRSKLSPDSKLIAVMDALEMLSMDKCAGILFVKTKRASPFVDWSKVENNRSTSIDALRGFLILLSIYSQLVVLGCLPVPFMWSKWGDAMFPFYRSLHTQIFLNMNIWTESFYIISAYLIAVKLLENFRPRTIIIGGDSSEATLFRKPNIDTSQTMPIPNFFSFAIKRYLRLVIPMLAFILLNYVWPQLSNGFVMQDLANKLMSPCDKFGWTNLLLFHNQYGLNETCLWPSHVSASFFQLHLLSYPIFLLCLVCLYSEFEHQSNHFSADSYNCNNINSITSSGRKNRRLLLRLMKLATYGLMGSLILVGAILPALKASGQELIVPFLIDYIDYDNYQRVLEWMVVPTYSHLTSYMFGILIAFIVIQKRSKRDQRLVIPSSLSDSWFYNNNGNATTAGDTTGGYTNREGSPESAHSSLTQELQSSDGGIIFNKPQNQLGHGFQSAQMKYSVSSATSSMSGERNLEKFQPSDGDDDECVNWLWDLVKSLGLILLTYLALSSSWFWNGLGRPMDVQQTFWYVLITKLVFCSTFSYLFYKHFAIRRNCNNPWMITRFLVPIGRMSLTTFYMSWLVIWFELLSSLYQWHPSHYFVFEKFTEVMFLTLILSILVYGAFEGILKRIQYSIRIERVARDQKYLAEVRATNGLRQARLRQVKWFESFFHPIEKKMSDDADGSTGEQREDLIIGKGKQGSIQLEQNHKSPSIVESQLIADGIQQASRHQQVTKGAHSLTTTTRASQLTAVGGRGVTSNQRRDLSPVERSKLYAELRANYSFASIGLYESAGATGDLSQLHGSQTSFDPQVSPTPSLPDDRAKL